MKQMFGGVGLAVVVIGGCTADVVSGSGEGATAAGGLPPPWLFGHDVALRIAQ